MERPSTFQGQTEYSVASLLFILAKHGGEFTNLIVNSGGIPIFLKEALLPDWIGRYDVLKVLGIMAKDQDHALQIEKAGGSMMLMKVIIYYLKYVDETHSVMILGRRIITEYEDDRLVICCLKTFSLLVNHEEIAKQISTRKENFKECGIITLVHVMQFASQVWSSITLTLCGSVVSKKLMQIKGHILTILSNIVSTLALMAKLHPCIDISRKVNEDVLKGIFQLEGMVIDEHQALKEALQELLDIKEFHTKHGIVNNYAQR